MKKKLLIITYGCQMNVYDSGRMEDILKPLGYEMTNDVAEANFVILNTCHIREKAAEKVYSELGRVKRHKEKKIKNGEEMIVAIAGCVGQAEGKEIFRRAPFVDIVVGPQTYQNLPELIAKVYRQKKKQLDLEFPKEPKFDSLPKKISPQGVTAFLSVQEGCDKFCKFCVVPYTRGAEFSRPVEAIYREGQAIVGHGTKELTLLGQNVTSYHGVGPDGQEISMAKLLQHVASIPGLKRLRYMTSHPTDFDDELIDLHGSLPKLMPYLHLPFQSGSDKILKSMNRNHTVVEYLELIAKFRKARTDMAFSTDIIVGYPGETDQDFEDTMELVRKVGFAQSYSFKYSKRPGTPAAIMDDQVPEDIKSERLTRLQKLLSDQLKQFNQDSVDNILPVLFEYKGKKQGQIVGRTPYMQAVHIEADTSLFGEEREVMITECLANSLLGKINGKKWCKKAA